MSARPDWHAELHDLLDRLHDGGFDEPDRLRLNELLRAGVPQREHFITYMDVHSRLAWDGSQREMGERRGMAGLPTIDGGEGFEVRDSGSLSVGTAVEHPIGAAVELPSGQWPRIPNPEPPFPVLSTTHYPPPTTPFVESWTFSCMVATVIMGVMLLGFWAIKVTHHQPQVAETPSQSIPSEAMPEMVFVGRITGAVDVKWSDATTAAVTPYVPLGRKYALASGLMEITYDTGAKVILQGPCTYEVESTAGGYLALGKLTAKVEAVEGKGSRSKVQGSRSTSLTTSHQPLATNSSPLSTLHSPLFSVRTPTAVVTDLGTEFGVEVSDEGNTLSHVFRGSVKIQVVAGDGPQQDMVLRENESARVVKASGQGDSPRIVIDDGIYRPEKFVRGLPPPKQRLPIHVLAHFRLGEDDPGAVAGQPVGKETINRGRSQHLEKHGSPSYTADTGSPDSTLAMSFTGADGECLSNPNLDPTSSIYIILEAWARINEIKDGFGVGAGVAETIVYSGHGSYNGYGLTVQEGRWHFLFGGVRHVDSGVKCEVGKWTHVALVCEREGARLWVNGQPTGTVYDDIPNMPYGSFSIGGHCYNPKASFRGQIDEVRLSTFLAPFRPAMLLLPEMPPTATKTDNDDPTTKGGPTDKENREK